MSVAPERRPLLDLFPVHRNRTARTCEMRCGNACFAEVPNTSDNEYFGDIVARASFTRRAALRASAVIGAVSATGLGLAQRAVAADPTIPASPKPASGSAPGLEFTPIAPATADEIVVPEGWTSKVVIRWGDPLFSDSVPFDANQQTATAARTQFGYNNDFLGFLPMKDDQQLLMVANHEYTDESISLPHYDKSNPTTNDIEVGLANHGLSVVVVERGECDGELTPVVGHKLNRRLHDRTKMGMSGPLATSEFLKTPADPQGQNILGTIANCSGGLTPWGTWLTAEENFNSYFANGTAYAAKLIADGVKAGKTEDEVKASKEYLGLKRYGLETAPTTSRQWEKVVDRFDMLKVPHEPLRYGWIVETDPYDPTSKPRKHSMLGRFKHESANIWIGKDGSVAAYSGDDERFDYIYKFVSAKKYDPAGTPAAKKHNMTLLTEGTLYVAKFTGNSPKSEIDGTGKLPADGNFADSGTWIPLTSHEKSFVDGFTVEEVLLWTRLAADKVGATKMDRPEDVEPHPMTGVVYVALTNNTKRTAAQADEPNPRSANKDGSILRIDDHKNPRATTFTWDLFLLCGDPSDPSTYFAGFDKSQVSPISCPDNVAFDSHGNLWISTDGNTLGFHDGLYGVATEGEFKGQVKQFMSMPNDAECCGPWVDEHFVAAAVQHPGESDEATFEKPTSHWPDGGSSVPRPAVVTAWKKECPTPTPTPKPEPTAKPTEKPTAKPKPTHAPKDSAPAPAPAAPAPKPAPAQPSGELADTGADASTVAAAAVGLGAAGLGARLLRRSKG